MGLQKQLHPKAGWGGSSKEIWGGEVAEQMGRVYEKCIDVGDGIQALLELDAALLKGRDELLEGGAFVDGLGLLLSRKISQGLERL
jgi:hypothetical protein